VLASGLTGTAAGFRITGMATLMALKILMRARIVLVATVIQPVIYATIAGFVLRHGSHGGPPLSAATGVAMMGAWTTVLFFAGGLLIRERRQGTLEMLVAAPSPLFQVVLGACLAAAAMAIYSLVSAIAVVVLFFGTPLHVANPAGFAAAVVAAIAVMAVFGVMLGGLFVLYRHAAMFQNSLEYPVWIASGLLVPLGSLPEAVRVIGWALPLTWANEALGRAVSGSGSVGGALAVAVLVGVVYLVAAGAFLSVAERRARVNATLRLS
jgi:ABC-2 type transport system permease protein